MKADTVQLVHIFGTDKRHVIPLFQRPYVWTQEFNWEPLWQDVRAAAEEVEALRNGGDSLDAVKMGRTHFLGAVVLERLPVAPGRIVAMNVIDGQQRLTTLQVLLTSAWAAAKRGGAGNAEALLRMFLNNTEQLIHPEHPYERYKVWPSLPDRDAFREVFAPQLPAERPDEHLLLQARRFFDGELDDWLRSADDAVSRADALVIALRERLGLVEIQLEEHDDAQVIFETFNDRGTRLRASDLVKNTLFRMAEVAGDDVDALYADFWRPFEQPWWSEPVTTGRIKRARLDLLLAYWLTIRSGAEVPVERLFADFRFWVRRTQASARDVLADLAHYGNAYREMESDASTDPVGRLLQVLDLLKTATPVPLLLHLQARPAVPAAERGVAAAAIESYLVRRMACGLTTKDYNRLFLTVLQQLLQEPDSTAGWRLRDVLAEQGAESRYWPDDAEYIDALLHSKVYRSLRGPRLRVLLGGIEAELRREKSELLFSPVQVAKLSVEHLLPQAWSRYHPLSTAEPVDQATARREAAIHRLGNLTLTTTKLNASVSNGSWPTKRSELGKHSVMLLTSGSVLQAPDGVPSGLALAWTERWDEDRIEMRGLYLANVACRAWPGPKADRT